MPKKSLAFRLLLALPRLLLGTSAGRKLTVALLAVGAVWFFVRREVGGEAGSEVGRDTKRNGRWSGLDNLVAPSSGPLELHGGPGTSATCTVRGKTGYVSGNNWVFRGDAVLAETSCEGRIESNGRLAAQLRLKMAWNGQSKGMGGDWEDSVGEATCEGDLIGTLAAGGKWKGKCKNDKGEWETSIDWKLDD